MPVLDRDALEASPLADLHAIASELGLDGFRRLRKADLIDRDPRRQSEGDGDDAARRARAEPTPTSAARPSRRRGARDAARRARRRPTARREPRAPRAEADARRRERRDAPTSEPAAPSRATPARRVVEGVVELLGNGSAFVRVDAARALRRRRLRLGRAGAPLRARLRRPRRRPGAPAAALRALPVARARRHDQRRARRRGRRGHALEDLPCAFPAERFALGGDDPTLKAIEWLDAVRPRLARRRSPARAARRQDRGAARACAGALRGREGLEVTRRARRRAPGGDRRVERRAGRRPRPRSASPRSPTRRPRRSSARSTPPSASPRAAATPSC